MLSFADVIFVVCFFFFGGGGGFFKKNKTRLIKSGPGVITNFMHNSAENEIFPAHKC